MGPSRFDLSALLVGLDPDDPDLLACGGDLSPSTLLEAYALGLFPMGTGSGGSDPLGWWCPARRGVLHPADVHVSRSLRRSMRGFTITTDTAFADVVAGCADPRRSGAWITDRFAAAYLRLHELGWARSVEVWADGELAGGLYGVSIGGLFAAESKFHRVTDASKAAVVGLARIMHGDAIPGRLIDVQWATDHLETLGVREVPRARYLRLLGAARALPVPERFSARPGPSATYDGG
ncbi:leucyl/phenylalanyl-tRNA--protein transferase [Kineococcus gynurae]|uniref:Leucyl/phenylalanyl-tRNA--protein transferase n=1 Tax=Kineococcus gynurae TaxID=452979 RepID=A0ABV5LUJ7_9ACTN